MTTGHQRATTYLSRLLAHAEKEELLRRLAPDPSPALPEIPRGTVVTEKVLESRWELLHAGAEAREALLDPVARAQPHLYKRNVENFIGTARLPVGVAGPLRVNGLFARGDFYIPLATTEATLVASYHRGTQLVTDAGGCSCLILSEGVSRAPGFAFASLAQAGDFIAWALGQVPEFRRAAESTTRHGRLEEMRLAVEANHVYLIFDFTTGDAAGQNMVTVAADAICSYILESSPVKPLYHFVEANLSGDKKASVQSFTTVRGRKVTAEARVPGDLVRERLHTTPRRMTDYWRMSSMGGVMSGTIGVQGHYANGLAALYIACGQDAACVAESAVGVTRLEETPEGDLYAAVTLPSLVVGTVGGGTGLPTQKACLEILGLAGDGHARAFAEVCAGLALAGELSIVGALCAGDFTRAHQRLARGREAATPESDGGKEGPP